MLNERGKADGGWDSFDIVAVLETDGQTMKRTNWLPGFL